MHEYVQKLTSTTLPRSDLPFSGLEFNQPAAPYRSGILPSSRVPDAIAAAPPIKVAAPIQMARFFMATLRRPISRAESHRKDDPELRLAAHHARVTLRGPLEGIRF